MMFFGGLTNIIDRAVPKTIAYWSDGMILHKHYPTGVSDYFKGVNSIFNIADVFIIMGVVLGIIGMVVYIYRESF